MNVVDDEGMDADMHESEDESENAYVYEYVDVPAELGREMIEKRS